MKKGIRGGDAQSPRLTFRYRSTPGFVSCCGRHSRHPSEPSPLTLRWSPTSPLTRRGSYCVAASQLLALGPSTGRSSGALHVAQQRDAVTHHGRSLRDKLRGHGQAPSLQKARPIEPTSGRSRQPSPTRSNAFEAYGDCRAKKNTAIRCANAPREKKRKHFMYHKKSKEETA